MTIIKRLSVLSVIVGICIGWGTNAHAQSGHYSAHSLSMGGTGTAYLDTYHANFVNPANLLINSESKPSTSLGILGGISGSVGGPLFNISAYNEHFTTGEVINQNALDDWFGSQAAQSKRMGLELDVIPLAGSWRGDGMAFSLAFRNRTMFSSTVNRGYAEVFLTGVSQDRFSDPKPVNFSSSASIFSEVSAGFSYQLLELPSLFGFAENVKVFAGIAPKYIIPQYTSSIDFNSTVHVTENEIIHDFQYTFETVGNLTNQFSDFAEDREQGNFDGKIGDYVEPDGSSFAEIKGGGFGVDIGGTAEMDLTGPMAGFFSWIEGPKKLRVGLSVTDIGKVTYKTDAGSFSNDDTFTFDGVDLDDGFSENFADSVRRDIYLNYEPGTKEKITKQLPTKLNLGGQLQMGKLSVALDFSKGFNDTGMNSKRAVLGFGTEYKLFNFLPLRAGYRTGGLTSSSITFGTGVEFRFFELTVGALTVANSEKRGSGVAAAWSGLVFRF